MDSVATSRSVRKREPIAAPARQGPGDTPGPDAPARIRRQRIRVAFCIDNMGIGGTELNALRTAERLDRSRFDVLAVCLQDQGPLLARYRNAGIPVLTLPLRRLYGARALRYGVRLARHLVRQRVDIVHSHDVYNNIFATTWSLIARTPVVIASRRWWDDVPRPALRVANRYSYRFAHCVVANSPTIADLLVSEERVPADRVAVISNFVDESAFTAPAADERERLLASLGLSPGSLVLGCVAGLRAVKDHATLIAAVAVLRARWPELRLVLVGDGEMRPALEQLTSTLGVADIVRFAGLRPQEPNLHHLFDISVLSSISEAFPNSIVEAMAAGKPVVATRVGGVADAVVDGETGLLVPPRDAAALAAAVDQLLIAPERRHGMGAAAAARARARFHASTVLSALESLYDGLLALRAR